jgi:hypothetical protein
MDPKTQIVDLVRATNDTRAQLANHWSRIERCVEAGQVDSAIPLLRAYFNLRTKLDQVEGRLVGLIKGSFSE